MTIGMVGLVAVVAIWIIMFMVFRASFKHRAMVAVPMGDSPDDVIWVDDKFKTRKRGETLQISFLKTKGKAYAPQYKWYSKWLKQNKALPQEDKDGWFQIKDADMRKHLYRGAFFYKASDDEVFVMRIADAGKFKILNQDTRELIVNDIEREKHLTTSFKDKLIQLGMWLGSLLVISLLAITIIVLSMKYAGEQSANIIQAAYSALPAQPVVGG